MLARLYTFYLKHSPLSADLFYFFGAPIKQCTWIPVPSDVKEQYLMVTYRKELFKYVKFSQTKCENTLMIILKVMPSSELVQTPSVQLHYAFQIPDGPVHNLAFLPSGGYAPQQNRLCMVAVATVSSSIKVYSLPINVAAASDDQANITIIETKPAFLLDLDVLRQSNDDNTLYETQCLHLVWSEVSGFIYAL